MKLVRATIIFIAALSPAVISGFAAQRSGPKKILLSFDGTGNNARDFQPNPDTDDSFSNVVRLHLLAGGDVNSNLNAVPGQICLYERGIAAVTTNRVLFYLRGFLGNPSRQKKQMRKKLEEVYEKGDKLYIIGFSRGAAAAREFVAELDKKGLQTSSNELIENIPIEFLGCFETVAMALGSERLFRIMGNSMKGALPKASKTLGETDGISSTVKMAVHNVAVDDNRFRLINPNPITFVRNSGFYPPVLMDSKDERVHETWFAGVHKDLGGSHYCRGLADCSLKAMQEWMESQEDGIEFIKPEEVNPRCYTPDDAPDIEITVTTSDLEIIPDPADDIHYGKVNNPDASPSYRPVVTITNEEIIEGGTVRVHESLYHHMIAKDEANEPYKINPNIKDTDLVVVGPLGKVLEDETEKLMELLKR